MKTPLSTLLCASALVLFGCSMDVAGDHDRDAERKADELVDHVDAVEGELDDCLEALDDCLGSAVDADDFAACGDDAATCLGDVDPPAPPDPPELPGDIGLGCADDLTGCVENDPTDPACFDAFDDCLSGELEGLCETAHEACVDAGAPAAICDTIAC